SDIQSFLDREVVASAEGLNIREVDGGLPEYRDLHAGAVEARAVQRSQIVNGREVVRRQVMPAAAVELWFSNIGRSLRPHVQGTHPEIVQPRHTHHDSTQRRWDGGVRGIRKMRLAIHFVAVDLDAERSPGLCHASGKTD